MSYRKKTLIYLSMLCAMTGATGASALDAGYYTSSSVLSSGHWVKIRVNESGIQQITHQQLREWGFDDPSAVTVYGFGGVAGVREFLDASIPDDLPQQPVVRTDDRLLFYGESNYRPNFIYAASKPSTVSGCPDAERNHAADAGYYFVTDSQPLQQPERIPYKRIGNNPFLKYHWDISIIEEEVANPLHQGQLYFGRDISQETEPLKFSFPLDDLYYDSNAGTYSKVVLHDILVGSGSNLTYVLSYPHRGEIVDKVINIDNSDKHIQFSSNANRSDSYISMLMLPDETSVDLTLTKAAKSTFTYAAIDRLAFAYQRKNILGDRPSMLLCYDKIAAGEVIEITQSNPDVIVWNVDNPYNVRPYQTSYNYGGTWTIFTTEKAYNLTRYTDTAHRDIVFDPNKQHLPVEYAGEVNNQDIHACEVPDLVILSADAFVDQAERLAQIHRDLLGHDVIVLRQEEIFNEFSSGTPSLWGIRKAMKMFYDRNPSKMKHLLLFGGAFYDNRGLTATGASFKEKGALLLNYGTPYHKTMSSITKGYSCDAYFGMLGETPPNDEFINNMQHINVGRIPLTDSSQAAKAVDKIYQYLTYSPASDIYQRVLLMADHGDTSGHMRSAEKTGASFLANNPGVTLIKGYSSLYPTKNGKAIPAREVIKQALKKGVMYLNYTGHGKPDYIGTSNLYHITDVHDTQYGYFPFAMLATCQAYTFDCLEQSIAQEMVMQNNGGMIGVIAACREVYQTHNETLSETMADIFSKSPQGTTTGDILRLSRNSIYERVSGLSDNALMVNTSCYNLCGDPAIPLFFSGHKITIDSVNGEAYDETEGSHKITPLKANTITGYIQDPSDAGSPWTSFNGKVIVTLYEPSIDRKCMTFGKNDTIKQAYTDEDQLLEANAIVTDGRFTVSFTPPMPVRTGDFNRTTITAALPDNSEVATTYTMSLACDPDLAPETPDDTEAPVITSLYIDSPDFVNGGMTGQDFIVYASVTDNESGIYSPTGTVGPTCRISIDDTMNHPVVGTAITDNGDGSIEIEYPFTSLSDGRHTLTLHISDNAGNSASRSIDFTINNTGANARLSVEEEPARIQATLSLQHNFTDTPSGRLIIEDEAGNTVYTCSDVNFPFEWDLTDMSGNLVSDGVYRAYAICKGGNLYGHTPKIEIIVVQQP